MRHTKRVLLGPALLCFLLGCGTDAVGVEDGSPDAGAPLLDGGALTDASASAPDGAGPEAGSPSPTCTDGAKNGAESDTDCGGSCEAKCDNGKGCATNEDCASNGCSPTRTCVPPGANDKTKNGTETDVDCGGPGADVPRCVPTKACLVDTDCDSDVCEAAVCLAPTHSDETKNGTETDVDCGGPDIGSPRCGAGFACTTSDDCAGLCNAGKKCDAATHGDGKKNLAETDVDCGGDAEAACAIGKACLTGTDCATYQRCSANLCAYPPSCGTAGNGTTSCGPGQTDNCCTTLPVPGGSFRDVSLSPTSGGAAVTVSPYKLDKYEITVGRMRAFLASKNYNLRGSPPAAGAGANPKIPGSGWQSAWNDRLPGSKAEVSGATNGRLVSDNGCFGGSDAHTWTADPSLADQKAANCVDWYTLFAFCAWDGGRLPTESEWGFAAHGGNEQREYAFGSVPAAKYFLPACSGDGSNCANPNTYTGTGYSDKYTSGSTITFGTAPGLYVVHAFCLLNGDKWCFSYTSGGIAGVPDNGRHVAPPGQKLDIGRWGHHDLSGNLIEWVLDSGVVKDATTNRLKVVNHCSGTDCANVAGVDFKDTTMRDMDGNLFYENGTVYGDDAAGDPPSWWRNWRYDSGPGKKDVGLDGRYQMDGGRVMRGGSWETEHPVTTTTRFGVYPVYRAYYAAGARCARD